jgi:sortase A
VKIEIKETELEDTSESEEAKIVPEETDPELIASSEEIEPETETELTEATVIAKQPRARKNMVAWVLILVGCLALMLSGYLYFKERSQAPQEPAKAKLAVNIVKAPSSVKPTPQAVATYTVAPNLPKYINISSINVKNVPILKLGLLSNGQIATPDTIFETGWYEGSSEPGQSGAMFIYGHVSSWTADGVFYNLKQLVAGDMVTITRGDNTVFTYQVVSSKVYPYNNVDMNQVLSPINPKVPGLNLLTCTGQVIQGTSEFNERLVVFTSLVTNPT